VTSPVIGPCPLPPLVVLTDRTQARGSLVDVARAAVDGGATAIVLREKDLPRAERARLAEELRAVLAPVGGLLLVASDPEITADGVHLAARAWLFCTRSPPTYL